MQKKKKKKKLLTFNCHLFKFFDICTAIQIEIRFAIKRKKKLIHRLLKKGHKSQNTYTKPLFLA